MVTSSTLGMDLDEAATSRVMAPEIPGSVSVALHPLVILNISDHWVRVRSQQGQPMQVIGALIGKQEGRNIEVMNSFELLSHLADEQHHIIDKEYYYAKEEHVQRIAPSIEYEVETFNLHSAVQWKPI